MYKCEKCHQIVPATKQYKIERPPKVLCIQLKRFNMMGGKNSRKFTVANNLDISGYTYKMASTINHIGSSNNNGHYTCYAKAANGSFYEFDDTRVRSVSLSKSLEASSSVYIIFYEQDGKNTLPEKRIRSLVPYDVPDKAEREDAAVMDEESACSTPLQDEDTADSVSASVSVPSQDTVFKSFFSTSTDLSVEDIDRQLEAKCEALVKEAMTSGETSPMSLSDAGHPSSTQPQSSSASIMSESASASVRKRMSLADYKKRKLSQVMKRCFGNMLDLIICSV